MMDKVLLVGIGGFIGSCARYLLGQFVQSTTKLALFPIGTLTVNLLGCFIIGLVVYLIESHVYVSESFKPIVVIGFLGGFTTFSSFGFETIDLIQSGHTFIALCNISLNVILGLLFVVLGNYLGAFLNA